MDVMAHTKLDQTEEVKYNGGVAEPSSQVEGTADPGRHHLSDGLVPLDEIRYPVPVPGLPAFPPRRATIVPLIGTPESVAELARLLLNHAGLSQREAASRMGIKTASLAQYLHRKRGARYVSIQWLLRLTHVCGARMVLELPEKEPM